VLFRSDVTLRRGIKVAQLREVQLSEIRETSKPISKVYAAQCTPPIHSNIEISEKDKARIKIINNILREKISHLNAEDAKKFAQLIKVDYPELFALGSSVLRPQHNVVHRIPTGNARPVRRHGYKIPYMVQPHADQLVEEQLEAGIIGRSNSPWNTGVVLVQKKTDDGSIKYRLTVDLRGTNAVTIPEMYPIPNITDAISNLANCKYFVTLDLKDGYYNIPIAKEDQQKTAFTIPAGRMAGQYEYKFMTMGLRNAATTFQRFVDGLLTGIQPLYCQSY